MFFISSVKQATLSEIKSSGTPYVAKNYILVTSLLDMALLKATST